MIQKTDTSKVEKYCSFENAHIFDEFAKILHKVGDEIEQSVGVFDAIREKDIMFLKLEEAIKRPAIDSFIHMQEITQGQIFDFVYNNFIETFIKYKSNFNFIHFAISSAKDLTFFISAKDEKTISILENLEYDYFIGEIHNYLEVNFCFMEEDMEKDLLNTNKVDLDAKKVREQSYS
tara:strand:+ start:428 stop:958 length:531 start_codon:yes stop_codon:yes gene_type:complete